MSQSFCVKCPDVFATEDLAKKIASKAKPCDIFLLNATLGMGKSVFARAFIKFLTNTEEVPSPTFTLVQTYPASSFDIYHFDLYRLKSAEEIWELNIEEAFSNAVSLVEWPEKMGPYIPRNAIKINITSDSSGTRVFDIHFPSPDIAARFGFSNNIHATTVDIEGSGVLIVGKSGTGKSDLALRLIQNKNAFLVADDQTIVKEEDGKIFAFSPKSTQGLMEVRGIGVVHTSFKSQSEIKLVVQSTPKEHIERFPQDTFFEIKGFQIPCLMLDFLEPSAPDKVVLKLKTLLEETS
ncbi:MAG: tRNA (adenosine(37)-N6)-threonylcarbamoyltransferase complex ATPase subunit type 1 TsaE [Alphaproteobacteria bacterium]|nr:tRNA (adenosine(37)-N6)-threonylcarbamoyltransferase complex ATPase subunit type 1 TsaE [Alphaproteobacteria bacterium]